MSQQFLSKYFKKSAVTNEDPGSAKSPSPRGKNARGKGVAGGNATSNNRRQRASPLEQTKVGLQQLWHLVSLGSEYVCFQLETLRRNATKLG